VDFCPTTTADSNTRPDAGLIYICGAPYPLPRAIIFFTGSIGSLLTIEMTPVTVFISDGMNVTLIYSESAGDSLKFVVFVKILN